MKKNTIKIITVVLSMLLLIGAAVGISAFANAEPTVEITGKNVSYEGAVKTLFIVESANLAEGDQVMIQFYDADPAQGGNLLAANGIIATTEIGGVAKDVIFSEGFRPKDLRKSIFALPVIVDAQGEVVASGTAVEYSPYIYAINRFNQSPTADQLALYTALLDYGAAVQQVLCTPDEVAANGGYANEYCGIRKDLKYEDAAISTGETVYYAPGTEVALSADKSYQNYGIFEGFSDKDGALVTDGAYNKATVTASTPGVSVYTGSYARNDSGSNYRVFDNLCTDGTEKDVNVKYKGNTGNLTSTLGFYETLGTLGSDGANSVKVVDKGDGNKVISGVNKGSTNSQNLIFALPRTVDYATKYVAQFDVNWKGVGEETSCQAAIIRLISSGTADAYDLGVSYLVDGGNASSTYTIAGQTLNKNEWHTVRYEIVPKSTTTISLKLFINGELVSENNSLTPNGATARTEANKFLGLRFYLRSASYTAGSKDYAYELDNVLIGYECSRMDGHVNGTGEYFNDAEISNATRHTYDSFTASGNLIGTTSGFSASDGVLTQTSSGVSAGFLNKNSSDLGSGYVFETDMKIEGKATGETTGDDFTWFGMSAGTQEKKNCFLYLRMAYSADSEGNIHYVRIYNMNGEDHIATVRHNEWFNIRLVYTPTSTVAGSYKGSAEVFINGVSVYTKAATIGAGTSVSNELFNCANFEFRGLGYSKLESMKYHFDNTFVGHEPMPDYIPGNGEYFLNTSLTTVTKTDYNTDTTYTEMKTAGVLSSLSSATNTSAIIADGILTSTASSANLGHASTNQTGTSYVYETDIKFEGTVPSGYTSGQFAWFGFMGDHVTVSDKKKDFFLYINILYVSDGNGNITGIRFSDSDAGTLTIIDHDEWANIRFVYTPTSTTAGSTKGSVDFYVNNTLVKSYTTDGYGANVDNSAFKHALFEFRGHGYSNLTSMKYHFDNTVIGTVTAE